MNLDHAMMTVAATLNQEISEEKLTRAVRSTLLAALSGETIPGLPEHDHLILRQWLDRHRVRYSDPASALYEQMLRRSVRRKGNLFELRHEQQLHKATGAYYTDDGVVRYMVERAHLFQPSATSLIDPACGTGAFLTGARSLYALGLTRLVGIDSDQQALALCRGQLPEAETYNLDALLDEIPGNHDLCLGNPPYISSGLRGAPRCDPERLRSLRKRFPISAQYKINTYPLFVERGMELLRPGGVLGYILPDSFLSGRYFSGIRSLLLSHTLLELTLIRGDFWRHGRVGQSVILFARKEPASADQRVHVTVCRSVEELGRLPSVELPLSDVVWGKAQRFRLLPAPELRSFVKAVESVPGSQPLCRYIRTYSGLIGRNGQQSLLRSHNPLLRGPWGRLLRSGKEVDRYWYRWDGEEVCLDPGLIKSGGNLAYYQNPKLLLRQTSDSLRGAYDDQGFYCLNNVHLLLPRDPTVDLRLMLGFINSTPLNQYYRALTMESDRLYAQVDQDIFDSLPIPPISDNIGRRISALVYEREDAAPEEAASIEQEIDCLILKLYGVEYLPAS